MANVCAINVPLAGRDQGTGAAIVVLIGAVFRTQLADIAARAELIL
jgi:hypothetical protein